MFLSENIISSSKRDDRILICLNKQNVILIYCQLFIKVFFDIILFATKPTKIG